MINVREMSLTPSGIQRGNWKLFPHGSFTFYFPLYGFTVTVCEMCTIDTGNDM